MRHSSPSLISVSIFFFIKSWLSLLSCHKSRVKYDLSLVSDIKRNEKVLSCAKNKHPLFLGLMGNFDKSNFSVLVSSQKIGIFPSCLVALLNFYLNSSNSAQNMNCQVFFRSKNFLFLKIFQNFSDPNFSF